MTTSDTPKGKMLFSSPENLASWGPSADSGVIACMTAADAQKAETLFNGLQRENNALREELASNRQAYRLKIEALEELLAEKDAALAVCIKLHGKIAAIEERLRIADVDDQPQNQPDLFEQLLQANKELDNFLISIPESAKQAAKVLEAAIEHYDIENEKDKKGRPDHCGCNVCQAVCGMKG